VETFWAVELSRGNRKSVRRIQVVRRQVMLVNCVDEIILLRVDGLNVFILV
jgi:hypothetical protein